MKKNTRQNIIETAISLFNNHGFGAISLHEIAQKMSISRGNLTYHFNTKNDLLAVIANEMWAKKEINQKKRRDFPSFENLDNETKMYIQLQNEYAFIFNDLHVMKHPILEEKFRQFSLSSIKDHEASIAFAMQLGNIKPEPFDGAYHHLCLTIWIISLFWMPQQSIRKATDPEENRKVVWSLILPHFTEKGIQSFKEHFGEDFYKSIGKPFKVKLEGIFF
jgi:AcrR family transcriptional regulator